LPQTIEKKPTKVACEGYCLVTLINQGKWVAGDAKLQAAYDGQLYHFADARKQAIFAADPSRYAPALGGDCVVSYAEEKQRTSGKLRYGIVHGGRLLFFADENHLSKFRNNPREYLDADLVLAGDCPMTLVNGQQEIAGIPDSEVSLDGLRYRFADLELRARFLANPLPVQQALGIATTTETPTADGLDSWDHQDPPTSLSAQNQVAIGGYCIVSLVSEGAWKRGLPSQEASYQGHTYHFADSKAKLIFEENPERYAPAEQGKCLVTLREAGRQVLGSAYHMAEYQGRLYLLAGEEEKKKFLDSPERYVRDVRVDQDSLVVTDDDPGTAAPKTAKPEPAKIETQAPATTRLGSQWRAGNLRAASPR